MCEEEIKKVTASVFKYILPDTWSKERKEKDPITAERVVEAIKAGKDVEIINAVIDGPFILKSVNAEGKVTIKNTTIKGQIDWSYVTFKRVLNLKNSIFETDATFATVTVEKDIFFDGATFCGKAKFSNITVMGVFYSRSTTFKKEVTFEDGIFKKKIEFAKSTFVGEANFGSARIGGNAEFTGATFKQLASFNGAQIKDSAFFNPAYLFSWDSVPGDDDKKLKKFLRDDFDIGWAGNSEILKSDDGKTIHISKDENSAEIIIDEKKEKATLKITDGRIHKLKVKKKNGKLKIYNPATFGGDANFVSARIGGTADFTGAEFKQLAIFNRAQIEESAFFNPATFEGEADFAYARIGSVAEFTGAEFKGDADFISARIGSVAMFNGAEFKQLASFNRAQIEESAFFKPAYLFSTSVECKDDLNNGIISEKLKNIFKTEGFSISQNSMVTKDNGDNWVITDGGKNYIVKKEDGKLNIYNPATFGGDANFGSARIGSTAEFTEAVFKQQAIFNCAQIKGAAFFNPATFEGDADFISALIGGTAEFTGAKFKQQAYFNSAQIERESHFDGTVFANDVCFQDTTLKTIFWGEPNVRFIKNIDLRGCIYDRFQPIPFWKQLMEHLDPYDRQPFTQLEETFRRAGKDKLADDVYYERKCRESAQKTIRKPGAWLLDRFLFGFTGYGVRLNHLLWAIVPILIIGTLIFHLEGAVTPEQLPSMMSFQVTLPWCDAFWVSLNTFLPIEIPSGADWKLSSQIIPDWGIKFTTFATLLVLAGWILVPVAVAGITGLLKRPK